MNYRDEVERCIKIVKKYADSVNTTLEPYVFFGDYYMLIETLTNLITFEKYLSFSISPSSNLQRINENREQIIHDFIRRSTEHMMNNEISSISIKKSKVKHFENYFTRMKSGKSYFSNENKEFIEMIKEECEKDIINNFMVYLSNFSPIIIDEETSEKPNYIKKKVIVKNDNIKTPQEDSYLIGFIKYVFGIIIERFKKRIKEYKLHVRKNFESITKNFKDK